MRLHQLKVDYEAEQDRLVMLVATNEGVELRLTLTRRFVKLLWPLLVKLAEEASPRIRTQANPEARKALLGLEHEHAVSKADFSKPYDAGESARPSRSLRQAMTCDRVTVRNSATLLSPAKSENSVTSLL